MSLKAIILLAFLCSVGFTFVLTACALHVYDNWLPLLIVPLYFFAALPLFCVTHYDNAESPKGFFAFLHTVFMTSTFALPIVLAHAPIPAQIQWGACGLTLTGCVFLYAALYIAVCAFRRE